MIRIPSDLLGYLRAACRDILTGTRPAIGFTFDDGTFEAYGTDALVFSPKGHLDPNDPSEVVDDVDDQGSHMPVYRVPSQDGHRRAQSLTTDPSVTVIVFDGNDLLREYGTV